MAKEKVYRVGISGSYGGLNLGDEAILESVITELRRSLSVEITVFSRNILDTQKRHLIDHAVPVRDLSRQEILPLIESLDLFILGGGGILYDADARKYLREVTLAIEKHVPVMVYAISAGPLNEPANQHLVRDVLNETTVITVRERNARKILEEVGVSKDILITADPALLLKAQPLPSGALNLEQMVGPRRIIGMSIREPGPAAPDIDQDFYHKLLANAADFMIDRLDADIIFIPMERQVLDMQHSHAVISQMLLPQRAWVLRGEYLPGQLMSLMNHFCLAVGMRLHFLIFAALQLVPFVALPYSAKVGGLLDDMRIPMPPIHLVNAGRLISYIDQAWDHRTAQRNKIREILPELRRRARLNNTIAVQLLTTGRIEASIKENAYAAAQTPGELEVYYPAVPDGGSRCSV